MICQKKKAKQQSQSSARLGCCLQHTGPMQSVCVTTHLLWASQPKAACVRRWSCCKVDILARYRFTCINLLRHSRFTMPVCNKNCDKKILKGIVLQGSQLLRLCSGSKGLQCSGKGCSRTCKSNTSKHEMQDGVFLVTNIAGWVLCHPKAGPVWTNACVAKAQMGHCTLHSPTEAAVVNVISRFFTN
jgi:hypothetical protein